MPRPKFCGFLKRFWDAFIWSWDVLLHGNPAVDVFNGIKLAAGGELGIGVGEEDWGSGEREVLEGFIGKTEGLVDLVVSRFGNTARTCQAPATKSIATPSSRDVNLGWQIPGVYPRPSDGVIFSGIGALTRASVRDVSSWMEWLYMHGKDGYGVRDNPSSAPRRKRRRTQQDSLEHNDQAANVEKHGDNTRSVSSKGRHSYEVSNNTSSISTSIPPPLVRVRQTQDTGTTVNGRNKPFVSEQNSLNEQSQDPAYSTDNLMKYLTLGVYGSRWGITSGRPSIHARDSSLHRDERDKDSKAASSAKVRMNSDPEASGGYFLIGLQGQLDEDVQEGEVGEREESTDRENIPTEDTVLSNRIVMRTLHLERVSESFTQSDKETASSGELPTDRFYDRLRVVVYVQKPFMFTFLFDLQTDALAMPSFYRSLHHHLGPLQRPLLASTSPKRVAERLWDAASPKSTASTTSSLPISDLIYDPVRLTVHTTIPNIPEPRPSTANQYEEEPLPWTRVEALSVHSQILNTYSSTRRHTSEQERTSKTGRQWWVVWMRLPHTPLRQSSSSKTFREAFLIRKASDYVSAELRKTSSRFGRDISGSNTSAGWGSGKLAEGIGIDARKYIEGILSLNR